MRGGQGLSESALTVSKISVSRLYGNIQGKGDKGLGEESQNARVMITEENSSSLDTSLIARTKFIDKNEML